MFKIKKPDSLICEINQALEKNLCLRTLKNVDFVARNDTALNVEPHIRQNCLLRQFLYSLYVIWNPLHVLVGSKVHL